MAHHQHDDQRRSALQSLLNMFHLSRTVSTNTNTEDDIEGDVDEPPDEQSFPFPPTTPEFAPPPDSTYAKCPPPPMERKVSLITRALRSAQSSEVASPLASPVSRALSRTSTFSNASVPSTAELTSDGDDKSPARSTSSSPPVPVTHILPLGSGKPAMPATRISFLGDREAAHPRESHESQIEANLGRKRLITFACSEKPVIKSPDIIVSEEQEEKKESAEPPKRKCMLTFACPARPAQPVEHPSRKLSLRESETKPVSEKVPQKDDKPVKASIKSPAGLLATSHNDLLSPPLTSKATSIKSPEVPVFQEFDISSGDGEDWAREPIDTNHKLTLTDVMKKENAIRKLGEEAEEELEEEAQAEEEAANELDDDLDDGENSDDFAPSDDGNESDNEAGFAESDDEDLHPDDQFWVPNQRPITSDAVQPSYLRPTGSRRQSGSSTDSFENYRPRHSKATPSINIKHSKHHGTKMRPLRPSTPDLPDSTDFVCGTLDEDRPLEAAYKSCLEQRKREKLIPIPQDIDPSFPTSDPDDMDEEDDEDLDDLDDEPLIHGHVEGPSGHETTHLVPQLNRRSSVKSPRRAGSPAPVRQVVHRSPPPPRATTRHHSPPGKGRLFGKSPRRMVSPPPTGRLRSPPGTRRESSTELTPFPQLGKGLITGRLAQRPSMTGTSSLPRTPNPFFHNYRAGKHVRRPNFSDEATPRKLHVRGPVDIVTGLETKRQKRKEKFWRQHCRKAAREQMERKTVPGRGAERMRELGLECAERNRAYGVQQSALVISI